MKKTMKGMAAVLLGTALAALTVGPRAWAEKAEASGGPQAEAIRPEEEKGALEFIRQNAPEMYKGLEHARQDNPDGYKKMLQGIVSMYRDPAVRQVFARNMKAEARVRELAESGRPAQGADKERIKKDLEQALGEQFDAKLAMQETQLKKMQGEIAKLQARIEKRRSLKDRIVKKRLNELVGSSAADDPESWDQ